MCKTLYSNLYCPVYPIADWYEAIFLLGRKCEVHTLQQRRDSVIIFVYCWSIVFDAGPTINQHLLNTRCLIGIGVWSWAMMCTANNYCQMNSSHWAHDVVVPLNQRQWLWFNVATTSCVSFPVNSTLSTQPIILSYTAITDNWPQLQHLISLASKPCYDCAHCQLVTKYVLCMINITYGYSRIALVSSSNNTRMPNKS